MTVYKTQIRDMKEETEELKITLVEKTEQLQEYRIKVNEYLDTFDTVIQFLFFDRYFSYQ